jgi:hypothetical protein
MTPLYSHLAVFRIWRTLAAAVWPISSRCARGEPVLTNSKLSHPDQPHKFEVGRRNTGLTLPVSSY